MDQGVRILVVDDEPHITELICTALRYEGFEIRAAEDGRTALRVAEDFLPDLIVLDVMLPDLNGFEVLRRMRAVRRDTPVIFLTARDATEDKLEGLGAGGDVVEGGWFHRGLLGRVAGAGIVDHGHIHVVPRWNGDTNFMPVLADIKVIPEHLLETRRTLAAAWPSR